MMAWVCLRPFGKVSVWRTHAPGWNSCTEARAAWNWDGRRKAASKRRSPFPPGPIRGARAMRILIVDDEPLACERIRTLLNDVAKHVANDMADVEIAGECHDGASAVRAIETLA